MNQELEINKLNKILSKNGFRIIRCEDCNYYWTNGIISQYNFNTLQEAYFDVCAYIERN